MRMLLIVAVVVSLVHGRAQQTPTLADANAKIQSGDFAGALAIAEAVVKADPNGARGWRVLGVAAQKLENFDRALAAYRRSLEIEPNHPTALYNIGTVFARKGDADAAFDWLGKARATKKMDISFIQVDPDLASLRNDPRFTALLPRPEDFADPFVEPVTIVREWRGEGVNDQFGWIARGIGDVDGDGANDFVTSAPTKDIGGARAGRVYVYSSRKTAPLWHADGKPGDQFGLGIEAAGDADRDGVPDVIASAPGGAYARLLSGRTGKVLQTMTTTEGPAAQFGRHVAGVGDVNHDGHADVIVGAPGSASGAGKAFVYSGKDGALLLTLAGERAGDGFGSAVGGDRHGAPTVIVVGAPGAGPSHHGRAYVYHAPETTPKFVIDADETGSAFGGMFVTAPGDVDKDGVRDVYVSDWSNAAKGPSTGRVYVISGATGKPIWTLTGATAGEGFGTSSSEAGDVDFDGHADLIVGAWQYAGAATSGGRAYLYSGRTGSVLRTFTCRTVGDTFGFDAVSLGDVDRDGSADLLVTSAWSAVSGYHSGRVFLVSSGIVRPKAPGGAID
jgi:hypothetical protein